MLKLTIIFRTQKIFILTLQSYFLVFKGLGGNSTDVIDNAPNLNSNYCDALMLLEKTIYCATVDQQDTILQVILQGLYCIYEYSIVFTCAFTSTGAFASVLFYLHVVLQVFDWINNRFYKYYTTVFICLLGYILQSFRVAIY